MIALLQRSVDSLTAERPAAREWVAREAVIPRTFPNAAESGLAAEFSSWLKSRTPEWWLSRLGIGFVIVAVLLLYRYAIDNGWITPPVRVLAGSIVGAVLCWAATRAKPSVRTSAPRDLGLRELLYGGGLAVWYVTAYAAAVWYQLIAVPSARLVYFVLGLLATLISLEERREIFAFVAVATGFATPFILTAPADSSAEFALYMAAVTAMGLTLYLMRGWPSIVWITFVAFWVSLSVFVESAGSTSHASRSVALTILVIIATAAFVRIPAMRRELLLLGSERYTPYPLSGAMIRLMDALDSLAGALGGGKTASDSLVLWVLTISSPVLAVNFLQTIWPTLLREIWGFPLVLLGGGAFALARRSRQPGTEVVHVEAAAAVLWTVLGIAYLAPQPESIPLTTLVATLVLVWAMLPYASARVVAKVTIGISLLSIAGHELSFSDVGLVRLRWVLSGFATVGGAGLIAQALIEDPREKVQGMVLGFAAYLAGLVVLWRALEPIWAPLVTTSYAALGAVLLILSRRPASNPVLKYLGGVTMVIVVARLLLVDLSSVETIWRVLLFLVCGGLFLYTGYSMQSRPDVAED